MFLIIILTGYAEVTFAEALYEDHYEKIERSDGGQIATVFDILEDDFGYFWFATEDGLLRYDGRMMQEFIPDPDREDWLGNSYLRCLYNDDEKRELWIGSYGGGLICYDKMENSFNSFMPGDDDGSSRIWQIIPSGDGYLYLATYGDGLWRFDREELSFRQLGSGKGPEYIRSMAPDADGHLLLGDFNGGLFSYDPNLDRFHELRSGFFQNIKITYIYFSENGDLWVGSYDRGLFRRDTKGAWEHFYRTDNGMTGQLSNNYIVSLGEDSRGNIYVGTYGGGLNILDPETGIFNHSRHQLSNPYGIGSDFIYSIYRDRNSNMWIGTYSGGINVRKMQGYQFRHFVHTNGKANSISSDYVRAFFEYPEGRIWIGSDGGGLDLYDKTAGTIMNFPNDHPGESAQYVRRIQKAGENQLWIGTYGAGAFIFDIENGRFEPFGNYEDRTAGLNHSPVSDIYDNGEKVFFATDGGGLNIYDKKAESWNYLRSDAGDISHDIILRIKPLNRDTLLLGTLNGVSVFDIRSGRVEFIHFEHGQNEKNLNTVFSIYPRDSLVWFGTAAGLIRYDLQRKIYHVYNVFDGLSNNVVYGIEASGDVLWLSTDNGINAFDTRSESFRHYNRQNGLLNNEFRAGAYLHASDGLIYFGSIRGFYEFDPMDFLSDPGLVSRPLISSLRINNIPRQDVNAFFYGHAEEDMKLELSRKDRSFSFLLSHDQFLYNSYFIFEIMLEGYDEAWISRRPDYAIAHYTNLRPGEYDLSFRVRNTKTGETGPEKTVTVSVLTPFWLSKFALMSYVFLFLAMILLLLRYYRRRIEAEQRRRDKMRELQLKTLLETTGGIAHELNQPLTALMGAVEILNMKEEDEKEYGLIIDAARRIAEIVKKIQKIDDYRIKPYLNDERDPEKSSYIIDIDTDNDEK